mgnify:CR=1 FL=1
MNVPKGILPIVLKTLSFPAQRKSSKITYLASKIVAMVTAGLILLVLRKCFGGFLILIGLRELFQKG